MSEDRFDREEEKEDIFANNKGVIKSWKGLVLAVGGFVGYLVLLTVFSAIPSLQWLTPAMVGLLFFVVGILFLKMSKTSYMLPLFAVLIGTVLMFFCISEKFFPGFIDAVGDKGAGVIIIAFGIIMLIYPFAAIWYYKNKYKETVEATVAYVDSHISRTGKGHHVRTYRPVYEFTYSGRTYQVMDKVYSSGNHPVKGEERELLIDEDNPEHFVDPERMKSRSPASYIVPAILLALGIYLVVAER